MITDFKANEHKLDTLIKCRMRDKSVELYNKQFIDIEHNFNVEVIPMENDIEHFKFTQKIDNRDNLELYKHNKIDNEIVLIKGVQLINKL